MDSHKKPKPNVIAERFKFNNRSRRDGESVADFIASLRALTLYCGYGEVQSDMIRDRLVCGVNEEQIQRGLLSEGSKLTLESAATCALGMEAAHKEVTMMESVQKSGSINKIDSEEQEFC